MREVLIASVVKSSKPGTNGKPVKLSDSGGLYLLVSKGGKYWRYNYRLHGKSKTLALGVYPDISLKQPREQHANAKSLVTTGVDPSQQKKQLKLTNRKKHDDTFETIAREWFDAFKQTWVDNHAVTIDSRLERDVFPLIGNRPISEIQPPEILAVA